MKNNVLLFVCVLLMMVSLKTIAKTNDNNYENTLLSTDAQPTLRLKKNWIDLNVMRDGVKGTVIHLSMEAIGYKGANMNFSLHQKCGVKNAKHLTSTILI